MFVVCVMHAIECNTDHFLVHKKLKIRWKRMLGGVKIPRRVDVSKLDDLSVHEKL